VQGLPPSIPDVGGLTKASICIFANQCVLCVLTSNHFTGVHANGQVVAMYLRSAFPIDTKLLTGAKRPTKELIGLFRMLRCTPKQKGQAER
jgi:hypothetical protein